MSEGIGFLLGAGASYELGMPLTDELTVEFKEAITRVSNLPYYKTHHKIAAKLISVFNQPNLNYEDIIGRIEVEIQRNTNKQLYQEWHGVLGRYLEAVYILLLERHKNNEMYINERLDLLGSIKEFSRENPLWIFSLNHDVLIEMAAKQHNIPIQFGFNDRVNISGLLFEQLTRHDMENNNFNFLQNKEGINLVKIHGSLDIFVQGDEKNYLKLANQNHSNLDIVKSIDSLLQNDPTIKNGVKCTNEITYYDNKNILQFLRMTIMSGKHKYSARVSHSMDDWFFRIFRGHINHVDTLYGIGLSFQDQHVNEVVYEWLSFSNSRKLIIVNPHIEHVPNYFSHLYNQIDILNMTFLEFINASSSSNKLRITLNKKVRNLSRKLLLKK